MTFTYILFFNITGRHIIVYNSKQTILEWTALLQVVINGNSANLSLLQNYAYFIDTTTNTTTIVTIILDENPCLSLVQALSSASHHTPSPAKLFRS